MHPRRDADKLQFAAVLAGVPALHADIGENFARGGIMPRGVSFYNNFYYFLDDTEDRGY
jgi:hypothetical protein